MNIRHFWHLTLALCVLVAGCNASSLDPNANTVSASQATTAPFVQLSAEQLRETMIGNTIVGRSNNFPQVGPIEFWAHYLTDGRALDRLRFVQRGHVRKDRGTWRIVGEQDAFFCTAWPKRSDGQERCDRIFVAGDQFRTEPVDASQKGVTGRIVPGNQVPQ